MTITIVANGEIPSIINELTEISDKIIACDGAAGRLVETGIMPDLIVGDMDSLDGKYRNELSEKIIRFDCQETNDLTKSFGITSDLDPDVVYITGITGKRADHELGNLSLLAEYEKDLRSKGKKTIIRGISDYNTIIPLSGSCSVECSKGDNISIISIDTDLTIESRGLKYPTSGIELSSWWKATLNTATESTIHLKFSKPARCLLMLSNNGRNMHPLPLNKVRSMQ